MSLTYEVVVIGTPEYFDCWILQLSLIHRFSYSYAHANATGRQWIYLFIKFEHPRTPAQVRVIGMGPPRNPGISFNEWYATRDPTNHFFSSNDFCA